MPLHLDVKKKLSNRSERVKSVDLHPTEPWLLTSIYNGKVHLWNIEQQQLIKTFEVCSVPVRCSKFIARKFWIIAASDDFMLRVFNYNTMERIQEIDAHNDYIRSLDVHSTQPFVISSSDDHQIKLWNWDQKWKCMQTFTGHNDYVMQVAFNPKDNNTFASASLDTTIKVWGLSSNRPNFTLDGHQKGVNCIDYYSHGDRPYLVSGADDQTIKIWDYQAKSCVQTLDGHTNNISFVAFHSTLPVIISGSEDETVRIWHAGTYRLESTLNYGMGRAWSGKSGLGLQQNVLAIGYDMGSIVITLGSEEPALSMDQSGKIVCAKHCDLVQANLRSIFTTLDPADLKDGERLPVSFKELGTCELYPQKISHNANGRFVVVCGDGEYIVYTAMALRNKSFGHAQEFVWAQHDASTYATREDSSTVKVSKNFKEACTFRMDSGMDRIFTGPLIGVRSSGSLTFHDWDSGQLIRRIEVAPENVYWNESGKLVAICTKTEVYILTYNADVVATRLADGSINVDADGVEEAFDMMNNGQLEERVVTGMWFGDAFIFTNASSRLRYFVGGQLVTVAHLERPMHLLGYLAKENRVFLGDRELNVVSFSLPLSVLEYETAVMRGDYATADELLPTIPSDQRTKLAQFLEKQGLHKQALRVTTDPDHKFELALHLQDLDLAFQLVSSETDQTGTETKWKQLAEAASLACRFEMAQECLARAKDYASLLLLATSSGNAAMLAQLAGETCGESKDNLAFLAKFLLGDLEGCLGILLRSERIPEAAFFARTYMPSRVPELVIKWRDWVVKTAKVPGDMKFADALANPAEYANLFPGYEECLKVEKYVAQQSARLRMQPATKYTECEPSWERDVVAECARQGFQMPEQTVAVSSAPVPPASDPFDGLTSGGVEAAQQTPVTDSHQAEESAAPFDDCLARELVNLQLHENTTQPHTMHEVCWGSDDDEEEE